MKPTPDAPRKESRLAKSAAAAFFAALVLLGALVYRDYGLSWDELDVRSQLGEAFYDYAAGGNRQDLGRLDVNAYHGGTLEIVFTAAERLLGVRDTEPAFHLRHLLDFLLFIAAAAAFYRLCRIWFGSPGFALFGTVFLLLSPRIFADAFYNSKDVGFLSLYLISLYTLVRFCRRPSAGNAALHALACGFLISNRILGILVPGITAVMLAGEWLNDPALRAIRRRLAGAAVYAAALPLFTVLCWPVLWRYPVTHFIQAFRVNSRFPWYGDILFMGSVVNARALPWYYEPVWIAVTLPPLQLLLFAAGLAAALVMLLRSPAGFLRAHGTAASPLLPALATIAAPLAAVIWFHSSLYNGWRHLYFIYPSLLAVGLLGAHTLWRAAAPRRRLRVALAAAAGAALAVTAAQMIILHPYEHLYFNRLAGRDLAQIKPRFELDYWGLSYLAGLRYILDHDSAAKIKIAVANGPGQFNAAILPAADRARLAYQEDAGTADYYLSNYNGHPGPYNMTSEIFSVRRGGATILSVYRMRNATEAEVAASPEAAAYRCQLGIRGLAGPVRAGAPVEITVIAQNKSGESWRAARPGEPRHGTVSLAARWFPEAGGPAADGGAWLSLPEDLPPGAEREFPMRLSPPAAAGAYRLRFEPFKEDVAWFGDAGGCRVETPVTVSP